ncbi:MAG: hypothetical protein COC15_02105, partial [Legionellales bacterium]
MAKTKITTTEEAEKKVEAAISRLDVLQTEIIAMEAKFKYERELTQGKEIKNNNEDKETKNENELQLTDVAKFVALNTNSTNLLKSIKTNSLDKSVSINAKGDKTNLELLTKMKTWCANEDNNSAINILKVFASPKPKSKTFTSNFGKLVEITDDKKNNANKALLKLVALSAQDHFSNQKDIEPSAKQAKLYHYHVTTFNAAKEVKITGLKQLDLPFVAAAKKNIADWAKSL